MMKTFDHCLIIPPKNLVKCTKCNKVIARIIEQDELGGQVSFMLFHRGEAFSYGPLNLACATCRVPLLVLKPDHEIETKTEITTITKIKEGM